MSEKNRFSKPVAFNNKKEDDQLILEHTKNLNFSGYAKKLMLADIKAKIKKDKSYVEPVKEETAPKTTAEKLEELKKKASHKPAN